ncbi:hypothetical protein EON67_02010 [archaeon]|nr:MAG: hypothetical protein EON67_02010 [archaeon]
MRTRLLLVVHVRLVTPRLLLCARVGACVRACAHSRATRVAYAGVHAVSPSVLCVWLVQGRLLRALLRPPLHAMADASAPAGSAPAAADAAAAAAAAKAARKAEYAARFAASGGPPPAKAPKPAKGGGAKGGAAASASAPADGKAVQYAPASGTASQAEKPAKVGGGGGGEKPAAKRGAAAPTPATAPATVPNYELRGFAHIKPSPEDAPTAFTVGVRADACARVGSPAARSPPTHALAARTRAHAHARALMCRCQRMPRGTPRLRPSPRALRRVSCCLPPKSRRPCATRAKRCCRPTCALPARYVSPTHPCVQANQRGGGGLRACVELPPKDENSHFSIRLDDG